MDLDRRLTRLRPAAPIAGFVVAAVWTAAIGFRLGLWHTGRVDEWWSALQRAVANPVSTTVAEVLAVVGTGVPAVLTVLAVGALVWWRRGPFWAATVPVVAGVSQLDVDLLKLTAGRARPDAAFGHLNSFPSGHTTLAAVVATLVAVLLLRGRARWAAPLWPLAMGWSRTALEAHWVSDVLAGAALGCATTLLLLWVAAAIEPRFRRATAARVAARTLNGP